MADEYADERPDSGEELGERVRLADSAVVAGADALSRHPDLSAVDREQIAVEGPVAAASRAVRVRERDVVVVAVAEEKLDRSPAKASLSGRFEVADPVAVSSLARARLGELIHHDLRWR